MTRAPDVIEQLPARYASEVHPVPPSRSRTRRVGRALVRPFGAVVRGWRRSLQVRVVVATIVLAAVVVAFVGTLLQRQIVDGVLETKEASAVAEASRGFGYAQETLDDQRAPLAGVVGSGGIELLLGRIVQDLSQRSSGGGFDIAVLGSTSFSPLLTNDVNEESVPQQLRDVVAASGVAQQTYQPVSYEDRPADTQPGLMVGQVLRGTDGSVYEMYYLFPLTQEVQTLAVVQSTLITAGGLLLGLIGLIAWFVVRQTVSPVRQAARIAERLASGGLQERMHVRGEDDMARLATSFNKMATSLQRQIRQLEDLSRMQQRFVSDVSHELRTPLTTVRMAADLLHEARPQLDRPAARAAELLQREVDRFENLLGELLEISRFDAGAAELEAEQVDCRDIVRQVAAAADGLAARSGSELVLRLPPEPCIAEVDPRRIDRILRNLVENAIEHGEGRPIDITVGADEDAVAVTVRDRGVGLRPGDAASVFNRFWRADPARTRTIGGTGLGLSIALEDTHLHEGWLQAWGRPGLGSQFRLTVPRVVGGAVEMSPLPLVPADATPVLRPASVPAATAPSATAPSAAAPSAAAPSDRLPTGVHRG